MDKGPKQTFVQQGHTDGQQTYKMMPEDTNHQRNAN